MGNLDEASGRTALDAYPGARFGSRSHNVFWPTIAVSLSDLPAAVFVLFGVWGLLLSLGRDKRVWLFAGVSGILFGLAAWLRSFYLYPAPCAVAVQIVSWLFVRPRRLGDLAILDALVPIGIPFGATWERFGALGFIDPEQSALWTRSHLTSTLAGYDTLVHPARGFPWKADCGDEGLLSSLAHGSVANAACLVGARTDFYLGSYSPVSYHPSTHPTRFWSPWLLAANVAAITCLAVGAALGKGWLRPPLLAPTVFPWLVLAQALMLVPEQRFVVVTQVAAWLSVAGIVVAARVGRVRNG